MRKLFYIFFLLAVNLHSQTKMPADTEFFYTYGGTNIDEARDIKETPDKGYILVGTTSSFGQGAASVYMIKTDSLGNHKWSSVQGGAQNDHGYAVELTYDGGFFVAGYSNSFYSDNSYDYSAYYFKTDANGNLLWQKFVDNGAALGGTLGSFIYGACAVPADNGYIMCGQTYATAAGTSDAYLIRVDKNGDTLWTKHYGGDLNEVFNSVCIMNNSIYAVGSNGSHTGADSLADGWIVKLNMNGDTIQSTFVSYGGRQQETLNGITPYDDSLFTVCGANNHIDTNSTTGIIIKYDTSLRINQDITLLAPLWGDTSNGFFQAINKIVNISYGSICTIGTGGSGGSGGVGMAFLGFSRGGYAINDFYPTDGGTQNDYGYSGTYSSRGRVIGVGGTFSTQDYCVNTNLGLEDFFLVRYNSDSIHTIGVIPEYNCYADTLFLWQAGIKNYIKEGTITLFPNPVCNSATLNIQGNYTNKLIAKVSSLLGEEILNFNMDSNQKNTFDFSSLSAGSYFLKIQDEQGSNISIIKFIVVH